MQFSNSRARALSPLPSSPPAQNMRALLHISRGSFSSLAKNSQLPRVRSACVHACARAPRRHARTLPVHASARDYSRGASSSSPCMTDMAVRHGKCVRRVAVCVIAAVRRVHRAVEPVCTRVHPIVGGVHARNDVLRCQCVHTPLPFEAQADGGGERRGEVRTPEDSGFYSRSRARARIHIHIHTYIRSHTLTHLTVFSRLSRGRARVSSEISLSVTRDVYPPCWSFRCARTATSRKLAELGRGSARRGIGVNKHYLIKM